MTKRSSKEAMTRKKTLNCSYSGQAALDSAAAVPACGTIHQACNPASRSTQETTQRRLLRAHHRAGSSLTEIS